MGELLPSLPFFRDTDCKFIQGCLGPRQPILYQRCDQRTGRQGSALKYLKGQSLDCQHQKSLGYLLKRQIPWPMTDHLN